MENLEMSINHLPAPTWNRLRMNEAHVTFGVPDAVCKPKVVLQGNVAINKGNAQQDCAVCSQNAVCMVSGVDFAAIPTGVGEELTRLGEGELLHLVAGAGKSTVAVTLNYAAGRSFFNRLQIEAGEDSELTVYMTYISTASAEGTASVRTQIAAATNAKVKLVQVQLLGQSFRHVNDVGCELADSARCEVLQLQLGADEIYDGVRAELKGAGADFEAAVGYYGRRKQRLDMNFVANHYGKKTNCVMTADGVLRDGARKLYRGTIDFKNGCGGAVGDEKETVLLLTDDVVNQSIPLILCSEEDVQGNHGASIGKLDEELLFYMMSRGFSEADAVGMMARAKIEGISRRIEDEETAQLVERYLEGVIADGE